MKKKQTNFGPNAPNTTTMYKHKKEKINVIINKCE